MITTLLISALTASGLLAIYLVYKRSKALDKMEDDYEAAQERLAMADKSYRYKKIRAYYAANEGLTQKEVAKALGVSQPTVSRALQENSGSTCKAAPGIIPTCTLIPDIDWEETYRKTNEH